MKAFLVLLYFICTAKGQVGTDDVAEGLAGRINVRGLEFIREQTTAFINSRISSFEFPEFSGRIVIPYSIFGLQLLDFDLGTTILRPEAPNLVTLGISGGRINVTGSFRARGTVLGFIRVNVFGNATAAASGINITQRIAFIRNNQGLLRIVASGCNASLGDFSLDLPNLQGISPSLGGVLRSSIDAVLPDISASFGGVVCDSIQPIIQQQVDLALVPINGRIPLPLDTTLVLTLSRPPVATNSGIEMSAIGRCFPNGMPSATLSIPLPTLPQFSPTSGMLQLILNDYVTNTYLASLEYNGLLEILIAPSTVSRVLGVEVTHDFISRMNDEVLVIDQEIPFIFKFRPRITPTLNFQTNAFSIAGSYEAISTFYHPNGTDSDISLLGVNFNITATIRGRSNVLSWEILGVDLDFDGESNPMLEGFRIISAELVNLGLRVLTGSGSSRFRFPSFAGYSLNILNLQFSQNACELIVDIEQVGGGGF